MVSQNVCTDWMYQYCVLFLAWEWFNEPKYVAEFLILVRLRLKYDGTSAETRFCLSAKRTSPFKSAGASVQSTTGSRGVRISGSNAGYTKFRGSEGYWLPTPITTFPFTSPPVRHRVPSRINRMYQYCVLYLAWRWFNEPKHVAEFLILVTNICCVYWLNTFTIFNSKIRTYLFHDFVGLIPCIQPRTLSASKECKQSSTENKTTVRTY